MSRRSSPAWLIYVLWAAGLLLVVAALIPILVSNHWWIRIFTFPQAQITLLLSLVGLAVLLLLDLRRTGPKLLTGAILATLAYQLHYLLPYTPLYPDEAPGSEKCSPENRLRVLVLNVLKDNRQDEQVLDLVQRTEPDLFLAIETDRWWADALQPLRASHPNVVSAPRENAWGMMLFSRLPLANAKVRYLVDDYVPSIRTRVRLREGADFTFYGLHPKPPMGHSTARGDAELIIAGREIRNTPSAAILAGDLNDVPWSYTSQLFQEVSGMLDPRVGRGFMASFKTDNPVMRWPLDHIFVTPSFQIMQLRRLPDVGSDHFPVEATLCYREVIDTVAEREALEGSTKERVREVIQTGRSAAN